ncbi:NUDIX domain-containing protein [Leisingera sp. McT4-56]|uniref:NUDIX domain-containing protein n=1 Tax=Leisingera sp. McT4-56 TaxID=2881255 RepID=UPI001CF8484C|nr:NUDIX domain-containing protein [Leisingera sp. McT4-56]MCB4454343.1 NUDIX domain-containing protein [Leisingera sp. McT4-56]
MADLFFFGTLRHLPLLELVLGRSGDALRAQPAKLPGHGVYQVVGQPFPAIEERNGAMADGVLVQDLSQGDLDRLNFYEGGFGYALKPVSVGLEDGRTAPAEVYFPEPGLWQTAEYWDLEAWVANWGALSLRAAEEVMAYYGRMSAEEVARCFPSVRRRAAAWLAGQARPGDGVHDLTKDVIVHRHNRAHLNFFAMEEMDLQYRRFDGSMSPVMNRSSAMAGHAAVLLPYDPVRDQVLLVEQFRAPPFIMGDAHPWMWEPVAGVIDPGETAEETAIREAVEEAGVTVRHLETVAQGYPSSGALAEYIHIFIGISDLSDVNGGGGVAGEGEDIRSRILSYDELMDGIDAQTYQDMPLVTAALWLSRHRERLRNGAV